MKNRAHVASSVVAVAVLAGGAAACTDAGNTLQILQNQLPSEGCVVSASTTGSILTSGIIESDSEVGYVLTPVVRNLAPTPPTGSNATHVAFIQGYNVDITFPAGGGGDFGDLTSFSSSLGAAVQPGSSTGFAAEVVPAELLNQLDVGDGESVELDVKVSFFGTMDGGDIESNDFVYPVRVCNGCLVENVGMCTDLAADSAVVGGACNPRQDQPLECCTSSDGNEVCPAVKETIVP